MRRRTRAPRHNLAEVKSTGVPQPHQKGSQSGVFRWLVDWVRAGYPEEAPRTGHSPLMALTGPVALTPRQTALVLEQLRRRPTDTADIGVAISKITDRLPTEHQLRTVVQALVSAPAGH